jgi:hypothetical protein
MPPGLKEAWTNGYQMKQYYTNRETGEVSVYYRPIIYRKSDITKTKKKARKKYYSSPSIGSATKYSYKKKSGTVSVRPKEYYEYQKELYNVRCKSNDTRPTFELPAEAYGKNCDYKLNSMEREKIRRKMSEYKIERISKEEYKKRRKEEAEDAIPDHKLTYYELMKRKTRQEAKKVELEGTNPSSESPWRYNFTFGKGPSKSIMKPRSAFNIPRSSGSGGGKNTQNSRGRKPGKKKSNTFGFSRSGGGASGQSKNKRAPAGSYSSSQSTSSTRMIYYTPNKGSNYEWGKNKRPVR